MVGEAGVYGGFDVTARGEYVLAEREDAGDTGLWLIEVARGVTSRAVVMPAGASQDRLLGPVLTRDGDRLFYRTRRSGHAVVVEQPTRGGGERVVYEYRGGGVLYLADVSADQQWVAIGIAEPGRRYAALIPRQVAPHPRKQVSDRISYGDLKLVLDGTPIERSAAMRQPYDDASDSRGMLNFTPKQIREFVRESRETGFQLMVHAVGDRAVETVVEALETDGAGRLRLEHGDGVFPDLLHVSDDSAPLSCRILVT